VGQGVVMDSSWERIPQLQSLLDSGSVTIIDQGSQEFDAVRAESLTFMSNLYKELGIVFTP